MDRSDRVFIALLVIGLAAATFLAVGRMHIEATSRVVDIIVDADDAERVAAASGLDLRTYLEKLRSAGASAAGVQEETLEELCHDGSVTALSAGPYWPADERKPVSSLAWSNGPVYEPYLDTRSPSSAAQVADALRCKFPRAGVSSIGTIVLLGRLTTQQLWETPLLLPPEKVLTAQLAGLSVVARLGNLPSAPEAAIEAAAAEAEGAGAKLVVFRGRQVLGYRELIPQTARALKKHGLLFGYVEIAEQKGQEELAQQMTPELVRVHSISDRDLETTSAGMAITRYARAVRERGIRACYIRLLTGPQAAPAQANLDYVSAVAGRLRGEGFVIGPVGPLSAPPDWPWQPARWLAALAVVAAGGVLLRRLAPVSAGLRWVLVAAFAGLLFALALKKEAQFAPAAGLLAASILPALGLTLALQHAPQGESRPPTGALQARAVAGLGLASLMSLVGGLLVVGLYAEIPYLQGAQLFAGVKFSYAVPLLLAFLVAVAQPSGQERSMTAWRRAVWPRLQGFFRSPVAWGGAIAIVLGLAAVVLALMRSGNESAVAPTGLELKARNFLETILLARPRTKEFLLGHPALMLAVVLRLRGRCTWLPLVALIAAFGQISLLNTFCHFHVPLSLSLLRSVHGVWIGAAFGVLLILLWRRLCDRPEPGVG